MNLNQVPTPWIWRNHVSPKRQKKHLRLITFTNKSTQHDYKRHNVWNSNMCRSWVAILRVPRSRNM
jgi:hypothetical protein